jgi:exodeoxyribonuclease VII large subunit
MDLFNKTEEKQIYSVGELNRLISRTLKTAFPEPVWVRGEVQRLNTRRSNYYFELLGVEGKQQFQIPVSALQWDRRNHGLDKWFDGDSDFTVQESVEVCLQCTIDFYAPFGKLSLKMIGLDSSFTLGQLEAQRRATYEYLKVNNLLDQQKQFCLPELPLRIGLITSDGSAADKDFLTGLAASGYPFQVQKADCLMMGQGMEQQIVTALQQMDSAHFDLIVITRGGGSRGDLSWFDQQELAVTIAELNTPVLTAIGHEIDTSIADAVAHTTCKTPTAAAEFLVDIIESADQKVETYTAQMIDAVNDVLGNADTLTRQLSAKLQPLVEAKLHQYQLRLSTLLSEVISATKQTISGQGHKLKTMQLLVPQLSLKKLDDNNELLNHLSDKVSLLDPARLLARGYTITTDCHGKVVCGMNNLKKGDKLQTRFRDGMVDSVVESLEKKR